MSVCVCVCVQRTVFLSISNYIMSVNTLAHHELILVETPLEIILVRNRWYSNNSNNLVLQHFLSSSAPGL